MVSYLQVDQDYSLYIHIPFCTTKCSYCAFYSEEIRRTTTAIDSFAAVLTEELRTVVAHLEKPFSTVFIGGGNPGLLSIEQLISLLRIVKTHGKPHEITIEMNPESLSLDHSLLCEEGVDRFSIGIQSLQEKHLNTLGRNSTVAVQKRAFSIINELKKSYDFRLNADLMTCIPGQSIADAISDIDTLIDTIDVDHISLYNLTIEEGTPLAKSIGNNTLHVMNEDEQSEMLQSCWDRLALHGFDHYEISNFSRGKVNRCLHNERYWKLDQYIGLGPSAAGTIITEHGNAVRSTGVADVHTYSNSGPFSSYRFEMLHQSDLMVELLLVGLRTSDGIDIVAWNKRFSTDFDALFAQAIKRFAELSLPLIQRNTSHFALTEAGFMILDAIVYQMSVSLQSEPS